MTPINKDYVKMYLVPPKVMERLQRDEKMTNDFDNNTYKIAKLRNLDPVRKWQLYRQELAKFMNRKREMHNKAADTSSTSTTPVLNKSLLHLHSVIVVQEL